jgi:predicted RNA binding protein YcfA (HicA-like mRNA interferase family)
VKALSGPELARLLESHGWSLQRINGSHHIYAKAGIRVWISVPIHGHGDEESSHGSSSYRTRIFSAKLACA